MIADLKLTQDGEKFVNGEGAKTAVFTKCDVTKRAELENLIKVSEKRFGDVPDVYIAGAGVFEPVCVSLFIDSYCANCCSSRGRIFGMILKRMDTLK